MTRARILPAHPRHLSAEQLPPRCQTGHRRFVSRRELDESLILAVNEYREFLTFYPTSPRADYAQLKLGMTHYKQMRKPQRDQSETREAIREFETFVERYPNSALMPEGKQHLREARDPPQHARIRSRRVLFQAEVVPRRDRSPERRC
jgi:hypothetical protein